MHSYESDKYKPIIVEYREFKESVQCVNKIFTNILDSYIDFSQQIYIRIK